MVLRLRVLVVAGLMVLGQGLPALALDAEELREKIAGGIAFYNARAHLEGQDLYGYSGLRVLERLAARPCRAPP